MSIVLKKFRERLMKENGLAPKIANVRAKKMTKILDSDCTFKHSSNLDDFNEEISEKVREIILEEIEELKKEKSLDIKEITYILGYSKLKNVVDAIIDCENISYLISYEIYTRRENMSIEFFENIKKIDMFSQEGTIILTNENKEEIERKYISIEDLENKCISSAYFDIIKGEDSIKLRNLLSDDEVVFTENDYQKLYLDQNICIK